MPGRRAVQPGEQEALPFALATIGLVTGRDSPSNAWAFTTIRSRWPAVGLVVRHALRKGPDAARTARGTTCALLDADPAVEVINIARGRIPEGLPPFSDEGPRAVAAAHTPVGAIGHELDSPILDPAADLRATTPTDAGKRVVPDAREEARGLALAQRRPQAWGNASTANRTPCACWLIAPSCAIRVRVWCVIRNASPDLRHRLARGISCVPPAQRDLRGARPRRPPPAQHRPLSGVREP